MKTKLNLLVILILVLATLAQPSSARAGGGLGLSFRGPSAMASFYSVSGCTVTEAFVIASQYKQRDAHGPATSFSFARRRPCLRRATWSGSRPSGTGPARTATRTSATGVASRRPSSPPTTRPTEEREWSWRESNPRPLGADSPCYDRSRGVGLTLPSYRVTCYSSRLSVRSVGLFLRVSGLCRLSTLILFPRQRVVLGVPSRVAM